MGLIPLPYRWLIAVIIMAAFAFSGYRTGVKMERADWLHKEAVRQQDEKDAILDRVAENDRKERENDAKNRRISNAYEKRLAILREGRDADRRAVDAAGGLRIDRAACDGFAAGAETAGAGRRDEGTAGTVRLPREIESRLFDLADAADEVTEQARACQQWITEHGFYGGTDGNQ
jgi:hypothetical protein